MRIAIAAGHPEGPPRGENESIICGAVLPENLFGYRTPGWM
jgi:hypothetical protein